MARSPEQERETQRRKELVYSLKKQQPHLTAFEISIQTGVPAATVATYLKYLTRLPELAQKSNIPISDIPYAWVKDDKASFMVRNPLFEEGNIHNVIADAIKDLETRAPVYPKIEYKRLQDPCCLIINITDLHIGGETEKAKVRAMEGVQDVILRAYPYNIEKIIFVGGNDIMHIDNPHRTTTKGTPVPSDVPWHTMFNEARELYIEILETLMTIAPIEYVHVLSNHDEVLGYTLSQVMQAWFRNCPNISFNVNHQERKYMTYGDNFIGFTHGHGAKDDQLPALAAHEAAEQWGQTKHRYIYCGHIHHRRAIKFKSGKDYTGLTLEWLRSSTDPNDYEQRMGFITPAGITSYIHSKEDGQIARLDKNF